MVELTAQTLDASATSALLARGGVEEAKYNSHEVDAIDVISPVNGVVVARVHQSTLAEVTGVIERSKAIYPCFTRIPSKDRAQLGVMITEAIVAREDLFKTILVIEAGKCISESGDDINKVKKDMDWSVDQVLNHDIFEPRVEEKGDGTSFAFFRKGIGPVGVIGPFNYPIGLPFESITPALLAGNPVILKPSELTPLSALVLEKVVKDVLQRWNKGLDPSCRLNDPSSVFQVVIGNHEVGRMLTSSQDLPVITAVTSTETGEKIRPVIEGRGGRFVAEQGGNAAVVVTEYGDVRKAVTITSAGLRKYCGQRCSTPRRMIAVGGKWDEMIHLLRAEFTQENIVGDPFDSKTRMGPLINEAAYIKMRDELKSAQNEAEAEIIGGELVKVGKGGFYVTPALVIVTENTDIASIEKLMSKETFAPIMYARKAQDLEEAIAITNQGYQHLTCGVFTDNDDEYAQYVLGTKAGVVTKNRNTSGPGLEGPYGGPEGTGDSYRGGVESWKDNFRHRGYRTVICNSRAELSAFLDRLGLSADSNRPGQVLQKTPTSQIGG